MYDKLKTPPVRRSRCGEVAQSADPSNTEFASPVRPTGGSAGGAALEQLVAREADANTRRYAAEVLARLRKAP